MRLLLIPLLLTGCASIPDVRDEIAYDALEREHKAVIREYRTLHERHQQALEALNYVIKQYKIQVRQCRRDKL